MQQPVRVAPSILAADFARLGEEVRAITAAGADAIHVDVMDGHFVPNLSLGPDVVAAIRSYSDRPFDVHLMVQPVDLHIDPFADAGADSITAHVEAGPHLHRTVQRIKETGKRAGVALNPGTAADAVAPLLGDIDLILVMTVDPGFGGQGFIESQLDKIRALRAMIDASGRTIDLQVDGGVNADTAAPVAEAGASTLVAGSASFAGDASDYAANIARLRAAAADGAARSLGARARPGLVSSARS